MEPPQGDGPVAEIVTVPGTIPVTTPVTGFMVATLELEEDHVNEVPMGDASTE